MKAASPKASLEEYASFIAQIELRDIWLVETAVQNHAGPDTPKEGILQIEDDPMWCSIDRGFRAMSRFNVRVTSEDDTPIAEIAVTFAVDFDSSVPMTEALFALFGPINLPLNTWPYLREYITTTFGRMNWRPFAIPALKRGTPSAEYREGSSSSDSSQQPSASEEVETEAANLTEHP